MEIALIILSGLFLLSLVFYVVEWKRGKDFRKESLEKEKSLKKSHEDSIEKLRNESTRALSEFKMEESERQTKKYNERLKQSVAEQKKSLQSQFETEYTQKEKELREDFEEKEAALRLELAEALEEGEKSLQETVTKVDDLLGQRLMEIAEKNTVTFNCVCSPDKKDGIDVQIDFTKENYFVCPKCGARYRVAINVSPVLVSSVSTN